MPATYTKLRDGSWGVRVTGDRPAPGPVTVTKKDGSTKQEVIKAVLWSGDGVHLCSVGRDEKPDAPRRGGRGRRTGCACGSIEGEYHDWYCASCRFEELDM